VVKLPTLLPLSINRSSPFTGESRGIRTYIAATLYAVRGDCRPTYQHPRFGSSPAAVRSPIGPLRSRDAVMHAHIAMLQALHQGKPDRPRAPRRKGAKAYKIVR